MTLAAIEAFLCRIKPKSSRSFFYHNNPNSATGFFYYIDPNSATGFRIDIIVGHTTKLIAVDICDIGTRRLISRSLYHVLWNGLVGIMLKKKQR